MSAIFSLSCPGPSAARAEACAASRVQTTCPRVEPASFAASPSISRHTSFPTPLPAWRVPSLPSNKWRGLTGYWSDCLQLQHAMMCPQCSKQAKIYPAAWTQPEGRVQAAGTLVSGKHMSLLKYHRCRKRDAIIHKAHWSEHHAVVYLGQKTLMRRNLVVVERIRVVIAICCHILAVEGA